MTYLHHPQVVIGGDAIRFKPRRLQEFPPLTVRVLLVGTATLSL
jgi:hypothetical protein